MSYLGQAALKNTELKLFNVTSSTSATHTLSWTAANEQSLFITINGVKQQEDAYSIAGSPTVITLSSALVATDKMEVVGVLDIGQITIVGDNTISTAKLGDNSVTNAKVADDAVGVDELSATGTASATTYLRGDNAWSTVSVPPDGGGTDKIFYENEQTVDSNYTVTANNNAMSAGIVTVASGITVTLTGTSVWTIV